MTPLEKDVEQHLTHAVGKLGGLCLKWVCPAWAGVPDRIVLLPGGRVFFAELKRPLHGRPSKLQIEWHNILHRMGFIAEFLYTHEAVDAFVAEIAGLKKPDKE